MSNWASVSNRAGISHSVPPLHLLPVWADRAVVLKPPSSSEARACSARRPAPTPRAPGFQQPARRWRGVWLAVLLSLAACAPTYDWREVTEESHRVRALFPGKPERAERTIRLGEIDVAMTLQGVRVDETMMTLGSVRLPADDADVRARALADMRAAMVRNIAGVETSAAQGSVALLDSSGREQARVPATQIVARGAIAGKTVSMRARFFARGARAWQAVVIGPAVVQEEADTFLDSVRVLP